MSSLAASLPGFSFVRRCGPGVLLAAVLAAAAALLAEWPPMVGLGLSALTLAIALGMVAGNTVFPAVSDRTGAGVDFARSVLLRAGIVLYGFRISLSDIGAVGWPGVLIAGAMVALTFGLAVRIGTRWLGLDRETAALIGAGSAICGAAAVMATQPVVRGEEHKVSIAVATVVVFGTLSMVLYPLIYPYLGLTEHAFGLFAGSTIHEVAQVVAVGEAVSPGAANAAVVEKMLRVMMLAPFLMGLSFRVAASKSAPGAASLRACWRQVRVPWFAVLFIGVSAVHSLDVLPRALVAALVQLDTLLLATAMAAMGLRTSAASLRKAGAQPLKLGALLFVFLTVGGYAVNAAVLAVF
ncbi:putative integral membrane protein (TIGR00698 family) [Variovorax sp. 54]|uniref:YeiH family protein n=1 Tax=Variovorax sp. 54 TaxID=2035212 RepID=UPI000C18525B|nr:YeiH family protein [Variovorax sp. 54]PIF74385.1 putative integral membrane protein (TIGR00698 family) [Variovorax sp. 54]